jgi:apolipoprotein D and lipocalin family protein
MNTALSLLKKIILLATLGGLILPATACVRVPEGVSPVTGFELTRYLGRWYEIARLDHWFEQGLENVFAEYRLRDDGGVAVINRGYDPVRKTWKEAQ